MVSDVVFGDAISYRIVSWGSEVRRGYPPGHQIHWNNQIAMKRSIAPLAGDREDYKSIEKKREGGVLTLRHILESLIGSHDCEEL